MRLRGGGRAFLAEAATLEARILELWNLTLKHETSRASLCKQHQTRAARRNGSPPARCPMSPPARLRDP